MLEFKVIDKGGQTASVDEAYERDEVAWDARMEEGLADIKAMLRGLVYRMEALEVAN